MDQQNLDTEALKSLDKTPKPVEVHVEKHDQPEEAQRRKLGVTFTEQAGQVDPTPTEIPQTPESARTEVEPTAITDPAEREDIISQISFSTAMLLFNEDGSFGGTAPFELRVNSNEDVNILRLTSGDSSNILVYYTDEEDGRERAFFQGTDGLWEQLLDFPVEQGGVNYITWSSYNAVTGRISPVLWYQSDQAEWDGNIYILDRSTGEILTITIPNHENEDPSQGTGELLGKRTGGGGAEIMNLPMREFLEAYERQAGDNIQLVPTGRGTGNPAEDYTLSIGRGSAVVDNIPLITYQISGSYLPLGPGIESTVGDAIMFGDNAAIYVDNEIRYVEILGESLPYYSVIVVVPTYNNQGTERIRIDIPAEAMIGHGSGGSSISIPVPEMFSKFESVLPGTQVFFDMNDYPSRQELLDIFQEQYGMNEEQCLQDVFCSSILYEEASYSRASAVFRYLRTGQEEGIIRDENGMILLTSIGELSFPEWMVAPSYPQN